MNSPVGLASQVGHPIAFLLPPLVWLARLIWPSLAAPVYIPTTLARGLTFKLMADLRAIPSLAELLNLAIRVGVDVWQCAWRTKSFTDRGSIAHPRKYDCGHPGPSWAPRGAVY
eukprot:scaffold1076_cov20-Tisochrysis_lutea.AAC.1